MVVRQAAIGFVVRTVRRSDFVRCVVLDRLTHSDPWKLPDYQAANRDQDTMILVAALPAQYEFGEELIGVCVAEIEADDLHFHRLAVHPEWQRCGVGSALFSLSCRTIPSEHVFAEVPADSEPHLNFWSGIKFEHLPQRDRDGLCIYRR